MCIAIIKPQGIKSPSEEIMQQCFSRNPDGAGFCYARDNKIHIRKGFMDWESFIKEYRSVDKLLHLKDSTVFLHFRIATHGGICKGNCHPFPVVDTFIEMQKEYSIVRKGGYAAMHNGVLRIDASKTASDTMHYLKNLYGLDFWRNPSIQNLIKLSSAGSKLAFMNTKGHYQYYGEWIKDKDILYSNAGYVITQVCRTFGRQLDLTAWGMKPPTSYDGDEKIACRKYTNHSCGECVYGEQCWHTIDDAFASIAPDDCFEKKEEGVS